MSVHHRYQRFLPDQREFFDALITENWDTYSSEDWDSVRRYEIAKLFERVQPATVLDIGCGCGFHDKEMAEFQFVSEVHAVDYSAKSIETANRQYPHAKVKRSTADLRELACAGYDLAVSWQVFEHLDNPAAYFESVLRVTKPGGWIAIFTPNRLRLSNVLRTIKRQPIQYCDPQHFYEYTPSEIKNIGQRFGLKYIDWFGYRLSGHSWIEKLPIYKRLVLGACFPRIADVFCILFQKHLEIL